MSTRLSLEPYEPGHLKTFKPGEHDVATTVKLGVVEGWQGMAASARLEGRTLAIGGIAIVEGTAHVWVVLSDEMRARPLELCRIAKDAVESFMALPDVERIEIEAVDPVARKWAEWLGFRPVFRRDAYDLTRLEYA